MVAESVNVLHQWGREGLQVLFVTFVHVIIVKVYWSFAAKCISNRHRREATNMGDPGSCFWCTQRSINNFIGGRTMLYGSSKISLIRWLILFYFLFSQKLSHIYLHFFKIKDEKLTYHFWIFLIFLFLNVRVIINNFSLLGCKKRV